MIVFTQEYIKYARESDGSVLLDENDEPVERTLFEVHTLLSLIKCSDASDEEKDKCVKEIEVFLNGGVKHMRKDVLEDIKAGQADTDDIGVFNA